MAWQNVINIVKASEGATEEEAIAYIREVLDGDNGINDIDTLLMSLEDN